jgi:heptaprenyl diphosphate synthase
MEIVYVQQRVNLDLRVEKLRGSVHSEMEHKYLSQFLLPPSLDLLQVALADAMLQAAGVEPRHQEAIVMSLSLIYHGLAVHDEIEEYAAREDERYRQLGVLAGDYFSSKYYRLLAGEGQIALIGVLSRAIQAINEAKAELERDPEDFSLRADRYRELQETIHGMLLHSLRTVYLPNDPLWEEIITLLVRAAVFHKELRKDSSQVWSRTWANLLVFEQASGEERKWLKHLPVGKRADQRLLSLHVKYGTSSSLNQQVAETVSEGMERIGRLPEMVDDLMRICKGLLEMRALPLVCEEG